MKRLLALVAGSAVAFFMGIAPASADNGPHVSLAVTQATTGVVIAQAGAGKCAGCHRAHTAQASYLLVQEQPALCYTCHDGTAASTDVKDGIDVANGGALRGGGFDTAMIGSGLATKDALTLSPYGWSASNQQIPVVPAAATTSKHAINVAGTMWGNGAIDSGAGTAVTLECGSCHDPHGNGNYRILRPVPNDAGAATSVTVPDATTKVYTTTNYWLAGDSNVPIDAVNGTAFTGTADATADGYIQNVAAWCTTCHTRYLAGHGSYKTPKTDGAATTDSIFTYQHRSDANYKAGAANCITCHVAHGSNASMTGSAAKVAFPGSTTPSADSRLLRVDNRGTCLMCHNV